jgi:hypothetical protein
MNCHYCGGLITGDGEVHPLSQVPVHSRCLSTAKSLHQGLDTPLGRLVREEELAKSAHSRGSTLN